MLLCLASNSIFLTFIWKQNNENVIIVRMKANSLSLTCQDKSYYANRHTKSRRKLQKRYYQTSIPNGCDTTPTQRCANENFANIWMKTKRYIISNTNDSKDWTFQIRLVRVLNLIPTKSPIFSMNTSSNMTQLQLPSCLLEKPGKVITQIF